MSVWGQVKKAIQQANDIDDILKGAGGLAKDGLEYWMDNPDVKRAIGNARYANAEWGVGALPDSAADILHKVTLGITDKPEDYDADVAAYKDGGGRAVWEGLQGRHNPLERGVYDLAADPTTWFTLGAGGMENLAAKGTARIALGGAKNELAGTAIRGVARVGQATLLPDKAMDKVVEKTVAAGTTKAAQAVAATGLGRAVKGGAKLLTDLAPREQVRKGLDNVEVFYKMANSILNGTQVDEGLQAAKAVAPNVVQSPSTFDPTTMAQNAWNASLARPITTADVGDGYLRRGPIVQNAQQPVPFTSVANQTVTDTGDAVKLAQSLPNQARWTVGTERDEVEKRVAAFASGSQQVNIGKDPFTDPTVINNLRVLNPDIPRFHKGTTRQQYEQTLRSIGSSPRAIKKQLTPQEIDDALMVYDAWFQPHPALPQADVDKIMALYDDYTAKGLDVFASSHEDLFKQKFLGHIADDKTIEGLGDEGNEVLMDTVHKKGPYKGQSYFDALKDIEGQHDADQQILINAVGPGAWTTMTRKDDVERMLKDLPDKEPYKVWKKWADEGVDLLNHPKDDATFKYWEQYVYGDADIKRPDKKSRLSAIGSVWKGTALLSPRYHMSNISSAYFNTMLTEGGKGMASPREFWNQIRYAYSDDPTRIGDFFLDSTLHDHFEEFGMATGNRNLTSGAFSELGAHTRERTEQALGRILGQSVGRPLGYVLEKNRKVGVAIDAIARTRLWATKMRATFEEHIPEIMREIQATATKNGMTLDPTIDYLAFRDPQKALGYYKGLGFSEGDARHLSREIARVRNLADKDAIDTVHKGLFSYYRTRGDELISKVIPFHYYASRSTALYLEEMMRNPILAVNFARMAEEMFQDYENAGLNARQRGWVRVMGNHYGFAMLMNPDALLGFTRSMGLMGDNYENDETQLGGILKWMKAGGFGMYPWIDGTFNMMGAYGDTFEPDMLGIRHRALVGAAVNEVAAELGAGEGMTAAPYAEINAKAREHISQALSAYLPGWMSQPVRAKANDTGTLAEASYEKLIESRVIYNNPGMTNEDLFNIMNDPESPKYEEARREISRSGILNQLIAFTVPIGLKARESSTDVRSAITSEHYDAAKRAGVPVDQVTPMADAEFAANYQKRTGKAWSPNDFDKAQLETDLIKATPEARPYILQLSQYEQLGTALGKNTLSRYYKIKNGEDPQVKSIPKAQWEQAADWWFSRQPANAQAAANETRAIQQLYRSTHPEIDQFKNWSGQMSYLEDLSGGSLALYRERVSKGNPNAAKFFEDKKNELLKKHKTAEDFIEAMDIATKSFDAYLAVNGIAKKKMDQAPMDVQNNSVPFDPQQGMVDTGVQEARQQQQENPWHSFLQGF